AFSFAFLGDALYHPLRWVIDVFNLVVLLMVGFGFFRRMVVRPRLIPMSLDAGIILGAIAGLMITHFGYHGFRMIAHGEIETFSPVSAMLAETLKNSVGLDASHALSQGMWWVHVILLLGFLNYIPYSKHIHIVGALPNIFFRNLGQRGVMPKLDLENEEQWGV